MATVIWSDKLHRWMLRVQVDGQLKTFASRKAGIQGKKEVLKRYREWQDYGSQDRSKTLASKVYDNFLEDCRERLGERSQGYRSYSQLGRLYIINGLNGKRIGKMKKDDFQSILNNVRPQKDPKGELSLGTIKAIKRVLERFINYAIENEYLEPFRGSLYVPKRHENPPREMIQPEELKKLFEPSDLRYHKAFLFMACTGLRPSECLGLKWSDIENDVIYIRRGITGYGDISNGKTKNAKRKIPLGAVTKQILDIQRENTKHLKSEWIFCDKVGNHGIQSTMRNEMAILSKERGFDASPYCLRHTYISLMANTVPEQLLKMLVGHSSSFQTFEVYGHLVNGDLQKAAKLTDITFNDIQNTGD